MADFIYLSMIYGLLYMMLHLVPKPTPTILVPIRLVKLCPTRYHVSNIKQFSFCVPWLISMDVSDITGLFFSQLRRNQLCQMLFKLSTGCLFCLLSQKPPLVLRVYHHFISYHKLCIRIY